MRLHVTAKGELAPCGAPVRSCPLGDEREHFSSQEEGEVYLASRFGGRVPAVKRRAGKKVSVFRQGSLKPAVCEGEVAEWAARADAVKAAGRPGRPGSL